MQFLHLKMNLLTQNQLQQLLATQNELELAILVGSQATGTANENSDFDIAIRWHRHVNALTALGKTETLRRLLAKHLQVVESKVDLIDMCQIKLPMQAVIAEDGIVLKGKNSLAWAYFLQRTWRDLETVYWDKLYAT